MSTTERPDRDRDRGSGSGSGADDPLTRLRENVTGIVTLLVTGVWMAAMFTGQSWWLAALLVGYVVVIPIVAMLFDVETDRAEWQNDDWWDTGTESESRPSDAESGDGARDARDALDTLRERYAAGELTDEQFERKLDRLLATETLEDAAERDRTGSDEAGHPDRDQDLARDR